MARTSLEEVDRLSRHTSALQALGYRSVESFLAAARIAGPEMSFYLGEDIETVIAELPEAFQEHARQIEPVKGLSMGANLIRIPPHRHNYHLPVRPAAPALAPRVNLIAKMPPIRTQGNRATCVAQSALAIFEHYTGLREQLPEMSAQFLYWNCKENDGDPGGPGSSLAVAMPLLERDGCCLHPIWPYRPEPVDGNEGQGAPPTGAELAALNYKGTPHNHLPPTSVQDLKHELLRGRPIAFDVPVFNSWVQSSEVARTGELTLPIPGEQAGGGHAMCLVGFEDIPEDAALGGGKFLLRNSWSTAWAAESAYQPGYGTIPYAYIARYGMEAYSIA